MNRHEVVVRKESLSPKLIYEEEINPKAGETSREVGGESGIHREV